MIAGIVFHSYTGFTRRYAENLAAKLGLSCFPYADADKYLNSGAEIIFLSNLVAEKLQGYTKIAAKFKIKALGIVCLSPDSEATRNRLNHTNQLPENLPVFILPGGLDYSKIKTTHKIMLKAFVKMLKNSKIKIDEKTEMNEEAIKLLKEGGDLTDMSKLQPLIDWYKSKQKK